MILMAVIQDVIATSSSFKAHGQEPELLTAKACTELPGS
jgi:hypothetical protein